MAVIKRKFKKSDMSEASRTEDTVPAKDLLALAQEKGITIFPLDIERLVTAMGIGLKYRPLDDEVSGHLKLNGGRWEITINSLHHPKRQRFTLAHELGHYLLHRWKCHSFEDAMLFRKENETNQMEQEANRYAASLLMPEQEFRRYIKEETGVIESIANYFDVSAVAVRVRAKQLGLSGHGM